MFSKLPQTVQAIAKGTNQDANAAVASGSTGPSADALSVETLPLGRAGHQGSQSKRRRVTGKQKPRSDWVNGEADVSDDANSTNKPPSRWVAKNDYGYCVRPARKCSENAPGKPKQTKRMGICHDLGLFGNDSFHQRPPFVVCAKAARELSAAETSHPSQIDNSGYAPSLQNTHAAADRIPGPVWNLVFCFLLRGSLWKSVAHLAPRFLKLMVSMELPRIACVKSIGEFCDFVDATDAGHNFPCAGILARLAMEMQMPDLCADTGVFPSGWVFKTCPSITDLSLDCRKQNLNAGTWRSLWKILHGLQSLQLSNCATLSSGRLQELACLPGLLELTLMDCRPREAFCLDLCGQNLPTTLHKLVVLRVHKLAFPLHALFMQQRRIRHLHIEWVNGRLPAELQHRIERDVLAFAARATGLSYVFIERLNNGLAQQLDDFLGNRMRPVLS